MPRRQRVFSGGNPFVHDGPGEMDVEAFRRRQQADVERKQIDGNLYRRTPFRKRSSITKALNEAEHVEDQHGDATRSEGSSGGEEGWRSSEGERLKDFGVDENIEFYDEDDIPLAELLERRREAESHAA